MGKGMGHRAAAGVALQGIIADLPCGVDRLADISAFQRWRMMGLA